MRLRLPDTVIFRRVLRRFGMFAAHPAVLYWCLPYMMFILTLGTLAQKAEGLYHAQANYFHACITWLAGVPLPGGALVLALLTANLFAKFIMFSQWSWRKSGVILAHLGVLLLLGGGLWTAGSAREYYMVIDEGSQSSRLHEYVAAELAYLDTQGETQLMPLGQAKPGTILPLRQGEAVISRSISNAMLRDDALVEMPESNEPEQNRPGIVLTLDNGAQLPVLLQDRQTMPDDAQPVLIRRHGLSLPFTLALDDFDVRRYPASDIVRDYVSHITVQERGVDWPVTISMNKPLRYRGYTFYQAAFEEGGNKPATILNVVRNSGRLIPYLATLITGLGLALHLVLVLLQRLREQAA